MSRSVNPKRERQHLVDSECPEDPATKEPAYSLLTYSDTHTSLHMYEYLNMATVVMINRPDVVARIEALAARLTGGNQTEVVALALRNLDEREARVGSLFGAHKGSVTVCEGVDLTIPILEDAMNAGRGSPL